MSIIEELVRQQIQLTPILCDELFGTIQSDYTFRRISPRLFSASKENFHSHLECNCLELFDHQNIEIIQKAFKDVTVFDRILFYMEELGRSYLRKKDVFQYWIEDKRVCQSFFCSYYTLTSNQLSQIEELVRNNTKLTPIISSEIFASTSNVLSNDCLNPVKKLSRHVLVDRELWMSQISVCVRCSSEMVLRKSSCEGLFESHSFFCSKCQESRHVTNSPTNPIRFYPKKGRGYKEINILANVSVNNSGIGYQSYSDLFNSIGLPVTPKSGFHKLSKIVWKEASLVAEQNFKSVLIMLKDNKDFRLILCGDGAWAHRGWTSSQGCYVV